MPYADRTCDLCHRWTAVGRLLGEAYVCRDCIAKIKDDRVMPIPPGCVYRYLFFWWLALTGRINEG